MKNSTIRFVMLFAMAMAAASCSKKDSNATPANIAPTHIATIGLYEYSSGTNKRVFIPVTKVGTQTVNYLSVFDTGSTGMTLDANGILPASMITSSGITFTGDSAVVNGITVTSITSVMSYGNQTSLTKVYGNVAYAPITIGDSNGNTTTGRIPFFMYYKVVSSTSGTLAAHSVDVFGVGPGSSYASTLIASPLSYFTTTAGQTSGFRLAMLNSNYFTTTTATYVAGLLTVGLLSSDISSSGFIMHPFGTTSAGYSANIPATIKYGTTSVSAQVLFDTGTPSVTIIENPSATVGMLPANTVVTVTTTKGFTYTYTTASTAGLTDVENPNVIGDYRTIFSIDFFISNEYLTDYTGHEIGLKKG